MVFRSFQTRKSSAENSTKKRSQFGGSRLCPGWAVGNPEKTAFRHIVAISFKEPDLAYDRGKLNLERIMDLTGYKLTFDDEFDMRSISQTGANTTWADIRPEWRHDANSDVGYGHSSFLDPASGYDPFSLANGVLSITAQPDYTPNGVPGSWESGLITSSASFAQTYGYFEMRADLADSLGAWDAFWLMPADMKDQIHTGPWQELDIVEHYGFDPGSIYRWIHTGDPAQNPNEQLQVTSYNPEQLSGFHTYGMDWQPDKISFYFDGALMGSRPTPTDMHSPMYIIADLAVQDSADQAGTPITTKIDYIRAYSNDLNAHTVALTPNVSNFSTDAVQPTDAALQGIQQTTTKDPALSAPPADATIPTDAQVQTSDPSASLDTGPEALSTSATDPIAHHSDVATLNGVPANSELPASDPAPETPSTNPTEPVGRATDSVVAVNAQEAVSVSREQAIEGPLVPAPALAPAADTAATDAIAPAVSVGHADLRSEGGTSVGSAHARAGALHDVAEALSDSMQSQHVFSAWSVTHASSHLDAVPGRTHPFSERHPSQGEGDAGHDCDWLHDSGQDLGHAHVGHFDHWSV